MTQTTLIHPGDRFIRPEDPETIWTIKRLVDLPGLPTHAELVANGYRKRRMTLSQVALMDRKLYRPVNDDSG